MNVYGHRRRVYRPLAVLALLITPAAVAATPGDGVPDVTPVGAGPVAVSVTVSDLDPAPGKSGVPSECTVTLRSLLPAATITSGSCVVAGNANAWNRTDQQQLGGSVTGSMPAPDGLALPIRFDVQVYATWGTPSLIASEGDAFTYWPTPVLTGIAPARGPQAGGQTVTLTGAFFSGTFAAEPFDAWSLACPGAVRFGATPAASCTVVGPTQITAVTPPFAASNPVNVTVTGVGGTSGPQVYSIAPAPTIASATPAQGRVTGTTPVTLRGSGFTGTTSVVFGTTPAADVTVVSDEEIRVTAPVNEVGPVTLTVVALGGEGTTAFSYVLPPAPLIRTVEPGSSPLAGGAVVTITGTDLTGADAVTFGDVAARSFRVVSDSKVTATTPPRSGAGTVSLRIRTPGGADAVPFGYGTTAAAPRVISRTRITGVPRVGRTLRCTPAVVTGASTRSVRWLRAGSAIRRATRATYRVTRADVGKRLTCQTRASGAGGTVSSLARPVRARR